MQFRDSSNCLFPRGRVIVRKGGQDLATVLLDENGLCRDGAFSEFQAPFGLLIFDADDNFKFSVGWDGE